jgi:hypothetical protein
VALTVGPALIPRPSADDIVARVAAELDAPYRAVYTLSPDGQRVAVLEWTLHPPRPRTPVRLLRFGSFCYDVTRRAVSSRGMRIGRLTVHDTRDGRMLTWVPGFVAGEPRWSQDSRWLAGVRPPDDGHALWILDTDSGIIAEPDLRASSSLLNPGAGPPLWWADPFTLVTLRDAIDVVSQPGPGEAAESGQRDLLAIAGAARVDLVTVEGLLIARHVALADCRADAAGVHACVVGSPHQLATLLSTGQTPAPTHYCPWQPALPGTVAVTRAQPVTSGICPPLAERHDERGSALLRGPAVIHQLEPPRFSGGRPRPGANLGRFASYDLTEPEVSGDATLIRLVPLELAELPDPASAQGVAAGPVERCHLGAGTTVVNLYVLLPAGQQRPADIRDRFVAAVRLLASQLPPSALVLAGTSLGAAGAAMVLADSADLFHCAILRSGTYNRALTPSITCPVLIEQGTAEPNGAAGVMQACAFYDALRAAGRFARLVLLYNEGHATVSRDGIVTAAREELAWIERHTAPPVVGPAG